MTDFASEGAIPIGHAWLRRIFELPIPSSYIQSYVIPGSRRTEMVGRHKIEYYPRQYATGNSVIANLKFALRHEPVDIGTLVGALGEMKARDLRNWILEEPTGAFSRRAWFFYENFIGRELDVEDVQTGNYVDALDSRKHIVSNSVRSARHRVNDNLLGGPNLCVSVRRTDLLQQKMLSHIDDEARDLIQSYDPIILARAVNYLYTKETRSSFAIEGETPTPGRAERFVNVLKAAPSFRLSKNSLVELQGLIVDERYAADDWRDFQNFVGETVSGWKEEVHYICPDPEYVPNLMRGWFRLAQRLLVEPVDPVVSAAVLAFAFVFIHPFEDGNGRIHRFLIHHVLAKRGYSPQGIIFPVSAAILRERKIYDEVLESFSKPLMDNVDWGWSPEQEVVVRHNTLNLYRYFDATAFAEYLYDRVEDTVQKDLKQELGFVAIFDRAFEGVRNIVDMPDRRASQFIRICMQSGGRLSKAKRAMFSEISNAEIKKLEAVIQKAIELESH